MTAGAGGQGPESYTDFSSGTASTPHTHLRRDEQGPPPPAPSSVGGMSTTSLVVAIAILVILAALVLGVALF